MSDSYYGRITFGGKLKKSLVPKLKKILEDEFMSDPPDGGFDKLLKDIKKNPQSVELSDCEARNGHFEDLEEFLMKHGLTYNTFSEASYDSLPEIRYYSPEIKEEKYTICDSSEDQLLQSSEILGLLEAAQVLCKDLTKVPLMVDNDEVEYWYELVAKCIAKTGITDPIEVIKSIIKERNPGPCEVPPLEII